MNSSVKGDTPLGNGQGPIEPQLATPITVGEPQLIETGYRIDLRERCFRHLDTGPIQILLQAAVELHETAILQIGHTLLLVAGIAPRANFICGRHVDVLTLVVVGIVNWREIWSSGRERLCQPDDAPDLLEVLVALQRGSETRRSGK